MAARKKKELPLRQKLLIAFAGIAVILFTGLYFRQNNSNATNPQTDLLAEVAVWYPSAPWTQPEQTTQETLYGELKGEKMTATVTSDTASLPHFEMEDELAQQGYVPDNSLDADGPGSSQWGYKKEQNGDFELLIFSYKTQPSSTAPDEPIQFDCPCEIDTSVFASYPSPITN